MDKLGQESGMYPRRLFTPSWKQGHKVRCVSGLCLKSVGRAGSRSRSGVDEGKLGCRVVARMGCSEAFLDAISKVEWVLKFLILRGALFLFFGVF
jgi:hypothetical protein